MPTRNLVTLFLAVIISIACYQTAERNRYASTIGSAMGIIESRALEPRTRRDLFYSAMDGMMNSLDQHSMFIDPDRLPDLEEHLDQEFGGVGFVVESDPDTGELRILSPIVGTPAYEAGIVAGDVILSIDGEPVTPGNSNDAVNRIRGPRGSQVTLTLRSAMSDDVRDVTLTRSIIEIESVIGDRRQPDGSWVFTLEDHPDIGYIRITEFGEKTATELEKVLAQLDGEISRLILDLRDNAGGLLERAVDVCNLFLEKGVIVTIKSRGGELDRAPYVATPGMAVPRSMPMAVLINGNTASASEIVAACLQDHQRATIVGSRSYGKGTVQQIIKIDGGRSALKLTVSSYWRPSGRNIHRLRDQQDDQWGVLPDPGYAVNLDQNELRRWFVWRRQRDYPETRLTPQMLDRLEAEAEAAAEAAGEPPSSATPETAPSESSTDESTQESAPDPQLQRAIEAVQEPQPAVVQN